jgi:hypothetical protein
VLQRTQQEQRLPEANKEEVWRFLHRFKGIAGSGHIYLVETDKTDQTLIRLGLTRGHCKDEILALSVLDHSSGPQPDLNRFGEVWVFGKSIGGLEIYIKLKIVESPASEAAVCLSFHIAERPMAYPLKR